MKIEVELKGFTPILDTMTDEFGLVTAAVYGAIWRYAQMSDKVCKASVAKIGKRAGVKVKTSERRIKKLCKEGYIVDLTPNVRNKPHTYAITGKAKIAGTVTGGTSESRSDEKIGTSESRTRYVRESHHGTSESRMKKQDKIQSKKEKDSKNKTSGFPVEGGKEQPADSEIQINLDLPKYNHLDLSNKWIHIKDENDNLIKVFVTMTTPKKLRIAIPGIDGTKLIAPASAFYQNGYPELQPVIVGVSSSASKLTPAELEMKKRLIDLVGAGDKFTNGERIAEIKKCQEAAIYMVKKNETIADVDKFERWYPTHWQGKQGNAITLKTLSNLWTEFKENKNGSRKSSFGKNERGTNGNKRKQLSPRQQKIKDDLNAAVKARKARIK